MKEFDLNTYALDKEFERVLHLVTETDAFNDITLKAILLSLMQIQKIQLNLLKDISDSVRVHNKGFNEVIENLKTYNELTKINTDSINMILNKG